MTGDLQSRVIAAAFDILPRPFDWALQHDCCMDVSLVFRSVHGIHPMAVYEGRYSTELGAARILRRVGGLVSLWRGLARDAGLHGGIGGVGEIGVHTGGGVETAVICIEPGVWAGKSTSGMATVHDVEVSWRA